MKQYYEINGRVFENERDAVNHIRKSYKSMPTVYKKEIRERTDITASFWTKHRIRLKMGGVSKE